MKKIAILAAVGAAFVVAGCQSETNYSSHAGGSGKSASLRVMEQVTIAAHKCWIASKDPDFRAYRLANELNSFTGQPRFLLVPAKDYGGRPLLVVQARGNSSRVEVFGPLLEQPLGSRIQSDVHRWMLGNSSCTAAA